MHIWEAYSARGEFPLQPMLSAARESMAISSGSDPTNADTPESGNVAESSFPEESSPPCDAVSDMTPSAGAPNETLGPREEPGTHRSPTVCDVEGVVFFFFFYYIHTVTLRSINIAMVMFPQ
jgi:hypothetical protein